MEEDQFIHTEQQATTTAQQQDEATLDQFFRSPYLKHRPSNNRISPFSNEKGISSNKENVSPLSGSGYQIFQCTSIKKSLGLGAGGSAASGGLHTPIQPHHSTTATKKDTEQDSPEFPILQGILSPPLANHQDIIKIRADEMAYTSAFNESSSHFGVLDMDDEEMKEDPSNFGVINQSTPQRILTNIIEECEQEDYIQNIDFDIQAVQIPSHINLSGNTLNNSSHRRPKRPVLQERPNLQTTPNANKQSSIIKRINFSQGKGTGGKRKKHDQNIDKIIMLRE
ncbi:hypothetical protein FGO68_gene9309 [Halteria grandinella]|uniref:Uncharacterized protein n=1 Tax=Halteria grandinella TaxID=5974 RepID=A0A8J8NJJ1_HALGN|nr:hypothetical protein FGO68_gene9309 [Halteria grandinella]